MLSYTALDSTGNRVSGEVDAPTQQAALSILAGKRLTPIQIKPKDAPGSLRSQIAERRRRAGIPARQLGTAYRQIAELLKAGVPLLRSLRLLGNRKKDTVVAPVMRELADQIAEGRDLAGAMSSAPESFRAFHVAMVRAGEKGGFLETVFARLGQLVLRQAELRASIISSLIYPTLLVCVGGGVLGVLFGFFVPRFRKEFQNLGDNLPTVTKLVFFISDLVTRFGLITLGVLGLAAFGLYRLFRKPEMQRRLAEWKNATPIVGKMSASIGVARFCRLLGTMLSSGVPMLSALAIAKDAAENLLLEEAIDKAAEAVRAGQPLSGPLAESGLIDDDVVEMISVAEQANNLDDVLVNIADTIEQRVDRQLSAAVRLIEPLAILSLAVAVVIVALALILPMMQMGAKTR
jgi:general secretion pathway protein F/type IV pilus assembly protein PilC